jgi:flagellin
LSAYAEQISAIVDESKWNSVKLLDGTVSKRFQTGVDNGEVTTWSLAQNHDAYALGIAEDKALDASATATSASLTGVSLSTAHSGLSTLTTGSYSVEVLKKAESDTVGTAINQSASLPGTITVFTGDDTGTELGANGMYTFNVTDASDQSAVAWNILDADGNIAKSGTIDNSAYGSKDLTGAGLKLTTGTDLVGSESISFEYIKRGNVKYELRDGSDGVVTVDMDGDGPNTTKGSYGYFDVKAGANAAVDTGRGVSFAGAAIGSQVEGQSMTFKYTEANKFSVDVSTATNASNYMDTISSAMDTVNRSMASLGSLMARLQFKEEQVSVAQVNVEASYSRIMNANMAEEQVNASKFAILQQTATAMLAQANQAPQTLLSLFR